MIPIQDAVALLLLHFVADFLYQTDWMALNKSKRWDALFLHGAVYAIFFIPFGFWFWLITFLTHTITDAVTSRITSRLWFVSVEPIPDMSDDDVYPIALTRGFTHYAKFLNTRHWFFVMIGLDQLIHYVTLLITYQYIWGR